MPERAILREHFTGILDAAQAAATEYQRLAAAADDAAQKDQLLRLARDGGRHVQLSERLLEIVNE